MNDRENEDDLDHTVVVSRPVLPESADRADEVDHTVVVNRPVLPESADPVDEVDHTVVVNRPVLPESADPVDEVDHTVVVNRPAIAADPVDDLDHTVVVNRSVLDNFDHTLALHRPGPSSTDLSPAALPSRPEPVRRDPPTVARRVRIVLPDGTAPSPRAVEGAGAGTVDRYEPRAIPPVPVAEATPEGVAATRAEAPGMPSVSRASMRASRRTIAVVLLACAISVVGLLAIAFTLLRG
jgi:hypothetical protein